MAKNVQSRTHHPHKAHHDAGATGQDGGTGSGTTPQAGALSGEVNGTWSNVPTLPDVGRDQTLTGTEMVSPLGTVAVSGELHTPGFVAHGRATATLTLTGQAGSLTVQLVGPLQPGFGQPPASFQYTITAGTGAYAGASGSGRVTFQEQQIPPIDCPPNAMCVPLQNAGSFALTFQL